MGRGGEGGGRACQLAWYLLYRPQPIREGEQVKKYLVQFTQELLHHLLSGLDHLIQAWVHLTIFASALAMVGVVLFTGALVLFAVAQLLGLVHVPAGS